MVVKVTGYQMKNSLKTISAILSCFLLTGCLSVGPNGVSVDLSQAVSNLEQAARTKPGYTVVSGGTAARASTTTAKRLTGSGYDGYYYQRRQERWVQNGKVYYPTFVMQIRYPALTVSALGTNCTVTARITHFDINPNGTAPDLPRIHADQVRHSSGCINRAPFVKTASLAGVGTSRPKAVTIRPGASIQARLNLFVDNNRLLRVHDFAIRNSSPPTSSFVAQARRNLNNPSQLVYTPPAARAGNGRDCILIVNSQGQTRDKCK